MRKKAKVKFNLEQERFQEKNLTKKLTFTQRHKFYGVYRLLTGKFFSGNCPNNFKATLENIAIYVSANYGHELEMTLKACKKVVIPKPDKFKDNASKTAKYIC